MALAIALLSILATVIPVIVEVVRAKRDAHAHAVDAVRDRDRAELRAALERLRVLEHAKQAHQPLLPPGGGSL
jgi:Na+-transporting methylmalonyl-CoA/oxaloacetate decarboxylase gamma subunit